MTLAITLVTDRRRLAPVARTTRDEIVALEAFLDPAIDVGVDVIQIREPDLDGRLLEGLVTRVVRRARGAGVRVLVNDRADVAIAGGADGVHLRASSPQASRVRTLHPSWLMGRSVHEGDGPSEAGGDYVLFGTVFPSASTIPARGGAGGPAGKTPAGLAGLARAVAASAVPVLAIGGITPAGAATCAAAGAAGVAAIGLFLPVGCSPDAMGAGPATRALRAALAGARRERP